MEVNVGIFNGVLVCDENSISISTISGGKRKQTVGLRFLMRSVPKEAGGSLVFRRTQNSRAGQPMRQEGRPLFSNLRQIHFAI